MSAAMSAMTTAHPATVLRHRLASHAGWMTSAELFASLPWCAAVLEDHLSDLVVAGSALYNGRARQYRIAGEPAQRRAVADLLAAPQQLLNVRMAQGSSARRIAVARRVPAATPNGEATVVTAEIEIPTPADAAEALAQDMAIADIVRRWVDAA